MNVYFCPFFLNFFYVLFIIFLDGDIPQNIGFFIYYLSRSTGFFLFLSYSRVVYCQFLAIRGRYAF